MTPLATLLSGCSIALDEKLIQDLKKMNLEFTVEDKIYMTAKQINWNKWVISQKKKG